VAKVRATAKSAVESLVGVIITRREVSDDHMIAHEVPEHMTLPVHAPRGLITYGQHAGRMADVDASRFARGQVDVIHAHALYVRHRRLEVSAYARMLNPLSRWCA
jgi:hypothetical protein